MFYLYIMCSAGEHCGSALHKSINYYYVCFCFVCYQLRLIHTIFHTEYVIVWLHFVFLFGIWTLSDTSLWFCQNADIIWHECVVSFDVLTKSDTILWFCWKCDHNGTLLKHLFTLLMVYSGNWIIISANVYTEHSTPGQRLQKQYILYYILFFHIAAAHVVEINRHMHIRQTSAY